MGSDPFIRLALPRDVAELLQLVFKATDSKTKLTEASLGEALFEELKLKHGIKRSDPNIEVDENLYKTNSTAVRTIVAEVDGKLVGFLMSHFFYSPWPGNCYQIDKIYVEPQYRGKGIAKRMMDSLKEISKTEDIKHFLFSSYKKDDVKIMGRLTNAPVEVKRGDDSDWSVLRIDFKE